MSTSNEQLSREFRRFVRGVDALDDPVGVALVIQRELDPTLDPASVRNHVETLGGVLARRTNALPDPRARVTVLGRFLGRDQAFRGNVDDYGNPRNAFLGNVLQTKMGLPITLSILYLGVARVAGIPVVGVGLPGHFVVGHLGHVPPLFLDPFRRGEPLERAECDRIVRAVTGTTTATAEPYLRPIAPRLLMTRVLNNLQMAYWQRRSYPHALLVARMLCTVNPTSAEAIKGRAFIYDRMGRFDEAIVDYEAHLRRDPRGDESPEIERRVRYLKARRLRGPTRDPRS